MKIVSMLEQNARKNISIEKNDNIQINKRNSGVYYITDLNSDKTIDPLETNEFLKYMPNMKESKCQNYGSDD